MKYALASVRLAMSVVWFPFRLVGNAAFLVYELIVVAHEKARVPLLWKVLRAERVLRGEPLWQPDDAKLGIREPCPDCLRACPPEKHTDDCGLVIRETGVSSEPGAVSEPAGAEPEGWPQVEPDEGEDLLGPRVREVRPSKTGYVRVLDELHALRKDLGGFVLVVKEGGDHHVVIDGAGWDTNLAASAVARAGDFARVRVKGWPGSGILVKGPDQLRRLDQPPSAAAAVNLGRLVDEFLGGAASGAGWAAGWAEFVSKAVLRLLDATGHVVVSRGLWEIEGLPTPRLPGEPPAASTLFVVAWRDKLYRLKSVSRVGAVEHDGERVEGAEHEVLYCEITDSHLEGDPRVPFRIPDVDAN